ncbi:MAG: hypothetical protein V2A69_07910 [Pseudomonadota bacterium]
MTIVEKIVDQLKSMPESAQAKVFDFVEYIKLKESRKGEDYEWSRFSLGSAMREIKEEPSPYQVKDLKERF